MTTLLARLLKPTGHLLIIDGFSKSDTPPSVIFGEVTKFLGDSDKEVEKLAHAVPHKHGFTEEEMKEMFSGAGLEMLSYERSFDLMLGERAIPLFVAVGKPKAYA